MRAIALISGGLDSALAAEVIKLQGVDVIGVAFITPFTHPRVEKLAQNIGIQIKTIDISLEYLDLVKSPSFGYGKNLNPCIDCHIFMLKKAKKLMFEYQANFIITGEVLGQRPMSQNKSSLRKVEKESDLEGLLLRPLSAKLLSPSMPEQEGWVRRSLLFNFSGRSRKPQMDLAKRLELEGFGQPAGGCLLTDPGFSRRLKDLLSYGRELNLNGIKLLKLGRHFRLSCQAKLVLGRNQQENQRLIDFAGYNNFLLKPIDILGPTGILEAEAVSRGLLELSASILARYCDQNNGGVRVSIEGNNQSQVVHCSALGQEKIEALRV